MADRAHLSFLPWVRQGSAAAIPTPDTLDAGMPGVVDLVATLSLNGAPGASLTVRLRGPADVVGIDPNEIVRVDPRPGTTDFEPNYFPCIEFDRSEFPWLFTPARANGQSRLRPWLCLVVVKKQDGVALQGAVAGRLPVLEISAPARPADELPDLAESWAWAHAQTASDVASVSDALSGRPELSLSRLLCPRILAPDTDYIACVVPTFEVGRRAGLGELVADADVTVANALAPAWSAAASPRVRLPVYFSWGFRTGRGGDFESLVRLLHAEPAPPGLGLRAIDISHPGFPVSTSVSAAGATLDIEGALQPMERPDVPAPWSPAVATPFQQGLAAIVNAPGRAVAADPAQDPVLAPPLYGQWYAARRTAAPENPSWFDQLNLDPRNRVVAALGTRVVQEHQEALMAAAWQQAGDLQRANQRVRRLQLSIAVNTSLQARHFARLDDDALLRVSAPAFARIRATGDAVEPARATLAATVRASLLPLFAFEPPMRRIGRQRGPLTRRVASQGAGRTVGRSWIGRLNVASPTVAPSSRGNLATFSLVRRQLASPVFLRGYAEVTADALAGAPGQPAFRIAPEGQPVAVPPLQGLPPSADDPVAAAFRAAAREHLAQLNPGRLGLLVAPRPPLKVGDLRATLVARTRPQSTVSAIARASIAVGPRATPPVPATPTDDDASGVATIMAAPRFTRPMYEALRDLGQALLLPGLDSVTANTVLGLKTNRRFVESYLVGLNVEMGRELLWRGFPTDQRGTYFDQFWDARATPTARPDVTPLHTWRDRRLGAALGAPAREQFVLLLRSDLLRRYPTAVIYAVPARRGDGMRSPSPDPDDEIHPAFRGSMDPDVAFFGFDLSTDDMLNGGSGAGHYIVIQEQPTEPRFGLDVDAPARDATHLSVSGGPPPGVPLNGLEWGRNAAHVAAVVRQLPVRIAIHASRFVRA